VGIVFAASLVGTASSGLLFLNSPEIASGQEQARQLRTFCRAIQQAARTLELQEILDSASKVILEVTKVGGCSIKLFDPKTGKARAGAVAGLDERRVDQALSTVESMHQRGVMTRESVIVRDVVMRDFPAVNEQIESLICVPLRLEEKLLGAICIFGEQGQRLSPEMVALLSSLGDVVSLAIAHALVYQDFKNLVQAKTKFMFQASHELRSPLSATQSLARTLLEGHVGQLEPKQRDLLSRIDFRCQALSEVVGDLLVLAVGRAEVSTLKPGRVDFAKLLLDTAGFHETKAQEKKIDLEVHSSVQEGTVLGSEEGLRSVVTNLLSNAIKYTPEGGKVSLRLFESKEQIVLEVSDTGIGIPKEEQAQLFTEFFRASNARTISQTGTGLGLAIVKATVEQHGGSIDVESDRNRGTTFRVFLNKAGRATPPDAG
jgi:signal transduction histidine kinase